MSPEDLDAADPLAPFRDRFALPEGVIYLDGNSLGARPKAVEDRLLETVRREWGEGLITSWNKADWVGMPQRIGDKIAFEQITIEEARFLRSKLVEEIRSIPAKIVPTRRSTDIVTHLLGSNLISGAINAQSPQIVD